MTSLFLVSTCRAAHKLLPKPGRSGRTKPGIGGKGLRVALVGMPQTAGLGLGALTLGLWLELWPAHWQPSVRSVKFIPDVLKEWAVATHLLPSALSLALARSLSGVVMDPPWPRIEGDFVLSSLTRVAQLLLPLVPVLHDIALPLPNRLEVCAGLKAIVSNKDRRADDSWVLHSSQDAPARPLTSASCRAGQQCTEDTEHGMVGRA